MDEEIFQSLGIDEEWEVLNNHRLQKEYESSDTVSEVIIKMGLRIKREEFGEISGELSSYEKKIMLSAMSLAQMILTVRTRGNLDSLLASYLENFGKEEGERDDDKES